MWVITGMPTSAVRDVVPPLTLADIEKRAKDKLPGHVYDFYASGSDDEQTLLHNIGAFKKLCIRPRVLVDVSRVDTTAELFGWMSPIPIGIAPSAMQKLASVEGELDTASAAAGMGLAMTLSSQSTTSLEEVIQVGKSTPREPNEVPPFWMQLYLYNDAQKSIKLIRRAEAAGYKAIVLTVDTPVLGNRLAERRSAVVLPTGLSLPNLDEPLLPSKPQASFNRQLMNAESVAEAKALLATHASNMHSSSLTWSESIKFLRGLTSMKIILKGVMTSEDAALAVQHGVDGIIVSNHGGRQLNGACATIEALPEIVSAVHGRIPVILDGGVRTGADVFKALALGANFVLVGRPVLWGLAYNGRKGVETVMHILERELSRTMALAGVTSIKGITRDSLGVRPREGFGIARL